MSNAYFYAQIDVNGVCYSVAQLAGEITEDAMTVKLAAYDTSLRGQKYANGAWAAIPPIVVDPLVAAQNAKIAELDAAQNAALLTVTSSALGTPHTYLADDKSMLYMTGEYGFVKGNDYDGKLIPWYTVENGYQDHTAAQFVQAYLDARTNVQTVKVKHDTLIKQVNATTTIDAVNAIVW